MIELLYHNQKGDKQIVADKEWKKQLKFQDIRDVVLKKLTVRNYSDVGIMVYFLKLGTYFCVFKEFPSDRALDNHAIWAFIPKNEEASPKELNRLLNQVIEKVKCEPPYEEDTIKDFSSEVEKLGEGCKVEQCKRPEFLSADNKKIACRYYDEEDTLYDLLCNLYQPEYERFEAVLFLDRHSELRGGPEVEDLTGHGLLGQEVIEPSEIYNQLSSEIEVYCNGRLLKEPIFISKNGRVDLEFRRKGFVAIPCAYAKGQSIGVLDWKVRVDHDLFNVTNKDKKVTGFSLKINGIQVYSSIDVSEKEARNATVQIEKGGYEPCPFKKDNVNLLDYVISNRKVSVQLKKSDQEFEVIQDKYEKVKVVITTSKTIDEETSPIAGYVREGDRLDYDSWAFLNRLLFWLLMAGALVLGGVGGFFVGNWINSRSAKTKTEVSNPATPNQNGQNMQQLSQNDANPSSETSGNVTTPIKPKQNAAVEYLDNKEVWNKNDMEAISDLKGFWDMLNQFDIDKIKSLEWHNKLMDSKNYKEIVKAYGDKKSSDYKNNKPRNNPQDLDITVKNYINEVLGLAGNHSCTTGSNKLNKGTKATEGKTDKEFTKDSEETGPGENDF